MFFLHTYNPEPTAFEVGSLDIRWYGIIISLAVLCGLLVSLWAAKKNNILSDHILNLAVILVPVGLIGGRIGHIIGGWNFYMAHPEMIVKFWQGGLAIHGVVIASLLAVYIYSRVKGISFLKLTDTLVLSMPLMQAIGRWGNYFNQELFGRPTGLLWGIFISSENRPVEFLNINYFHPLFLYESILMAMVFVILLIFWQKDLLKIGGYTFLYFILFSTVRFSLDFLRIGMLKAGPLLLTQWISLGLFFGGILGLVYLYKNQAKKSGI